MTILSGIRAFLSVKYGNRNMCGLWVDKITNIDCCPHYYIMPDFYYF